MRKNILVTGHRGFIGSHLCRKLVSKKHTVIPLEGDLLDYSSLKAQVNQQRLDIVIHLAGVSNVRWCSSHPAETLKVNVAGTSVLYEALFQSGQKPTIMFASTAQIYAPPEDSKQEISESSKIGPRNIYGESKRQAEVLLQELCLRRNFQAVILRLFNHSHKSQSTDYFLPSLWTQILEAQDGGKISVGNLNLTRDIGLISDLAESFDKIIDSLQFFNQHEVINICSGQERSLFNLATQLARVLNKDIKFEVDPDRYRNDEPKSFVGSYQKAFQLTGWKPQLLTDTQFIQKFLTDERQ